MEECITLVKHNKEISVFGIKLSLELELFGFNCEIPLRWWILVLEIKSTALGSTSSQRLDFNQEWISL